MTPYPKEVYLEPSTVCQFSCIFCLNPKLENKTIVPFEKLKSTIEKFEKGTLIDLTGYGEFLIYPDFEKLISFLTEKEIKFSFNTNAQALDRKKRDILRASSLYVINFSLNTLDNELHYYFSGDRSNLPIIVDNIMQFVKKPRNFKTSISMVVNRHNIQEAQTFLDFAIDNEIENLRFIRPFKNVEYPENFEMKDSIEEIEILQSIIRDAKEYNVHIDMYGLEKGVQEITKAPIKNCTAPWRMVIIGSQGNVAACCNLPNYSLGNINNTSFEEIWNGEKANTLREAIKMGDNSICKNCSEFE